MLCFVVGVDELGQIPVVLVNYIKQYVPVGTTGHKKKNRSNWEWMKTNAATKYSYLISNIKY